MEITVLPNSSQEAVPPASDEVKVGAATRWQCLLPGDASYIRWIGGTAFVDYTVRFTAPALPVNGSVLYGYLTWRQSASRGTAKYVNAQFRCYPKTPFVGTGTSWASLNSTLQPVFVADGAYHTDNASKAYEGGVSPWTYFNGTTNISLTWEDLDLSTMEVVQHINNPSDTPVDLRMSELSLTYVVDEAPALTNVRIADIGNRRPTVLWNYSDPESQSQTQYRTLLFGNGDTDLSGDFPGDLTWNITEVTARYDSGWQSGTANSWRINMDLLTPPGGSTGWFAFVAVSSVTANGRTIYSPWTPSGSFTVTTIRAAIVSVIGDDVGNAAYTFLVNWLETQDGRFKLSHLFVDPNVMSFSPLFGSETVCLAIGTGYYDDRIRTAPIGVVMMNYDSWWPSKLVTMGPTVYAGRNDVSAVQSAVTGGITGTISLYATSWGDVISSNMSTSLGGSTGAHPEELVYSSPPEAMSFAYEAGFPLVDGSLAAGRRVALGIPQNKISDLSAAGKQLLANELIWAATRRPSQQGTLLNELAVGTEPAISSREVQEGWGTAL